jgi:hypothetical protein
MVLSLLADPLELSTTAQHSMLTGLRAPALLLLLVVVLHQYRCQLQYVWSPVMAARSALGQQLHHQQQ